MEEVWEIVLGEKVGPLSLGATLFDITSKLKNRNPVRSFEISYSEDEPFEVDIVINSPEDGFKLKFHPVTQILKMIEVYEVNKITLRYQSKFIFGKDIGATFLSVYKLLGPTYPGTYNTDSKIYTLHYPGGSFQFPIPKEYEKLYKKKDTIPVEFPNGSTPAALGFSIYSGVEYQSQETPIPLRKNYMELVEVDLMDMQNIVIFFANTNRRIALGSSPQDILSQLGPPTSSFHKSHLDAAKNHGEYFHNYQDLGLDILYSKWHTVLKVILRTNIPGHSEFNSYLKCNFQISNLKRDGGRRSECPQINPQTSWSTIRDALGGTEMRPIIVDGGSITDPFNASLFYNPVPGCLIEILKNDCIASITLSQSSPA